MEGFAPDIFGGDDVLIMLTWLGRDIKINLK